MTRLGCPCNDEVEQARNNGGEQYFVMMRLNSSRNDELSISRNDKVKQFSQRRG